VERDPIAVGGGRSAAVLGWSCLAALLFFFSSAFALILPGLGACGRVPCFLYLYATSYLGFLSAFALGARLVRMKPGRLALIAGLGTLPLYLLLASLGLRALPPALLASLSFFTLILPTGGAASALLGVALSRLELPPWTGWLMALLFPFGFLAYPFLDRGAYAAATLLLGALALLLSRLPVAEGVRHLPPYPSEEASIRCLMRSLLPLGLCEGVVLYLPYRFIAIQGAPAPALAAAFFLYALLASMGAPLLGGRAFIAVLHALSFALAAFLASQALLFLPLIGLFSKAPLELALRALVLLRPGVRPLAQLRLDAALRLGMTLGVVGSWALDTAGLWPLPYLASAALSLLSYYLTLRALGDQVKAEEKEAEQDQR
jgi:hypothetical protein